MVGKIKSIKPAGSFDSQHGTLYKSVYEFEDGTVLTANHKTEVSKYKAGDEVEYEVTKDDPKWGKSGKVSSINNFQKKGNNNASFALSYSKDIYIAKIAAGQDPQGKTLLDTANLFLKWLNENS